MQPTGDGVLQVEPTDHCNLSCRMCAPHFEGWETVHGVPKGHLDPALWSRIVDGLVEEDLRFDHIIFQWLGDPSLHPALPLLVGTTARKLAGRVGYLRVDTNGILLTPARIDALLDALPGSETGSLGPPLLIVFTIDANTEPAYAFLKGRDALARVRRHARYLLRRRRGLGVRVNTQLQFVIQPGNAGEAGAFLRYWTDLLNCQGDAERWFDEVLFKRLSVGGGAEGQAAADTLYEHTIREAGIRTGQSGNAHVVVSEKRPWVEDDGHQGGRSACPGLWLTPVIRHDGTLQACCADLQSELRLGSLALASFRTLWEGAGATRLRMEQLTGRFTGVCAGCGGINWYTTTPAMAAAAQSRALALGL